MDHGHWTFAWLLNLPSLRGLRNFTFYIYHGQVPLHFIGSTTNMSQVSGVVSNFFSWHAQRPDLARLINSSFSKSNHGGGEGDA